LFIGDIKNIRFTYQSGRAIQVAIAAIQGLVGEDGACGAVFDARLLCAGRHHRQEAAMTTRNFLRPTGLSGQAFSVRLPACIVLPIAAGTAIRVAFIIIAALVRGAKLVTRGIRNRRAAIVLAHLDARLLADIGLTPFDVRDAAATPMWDDPTALLRARALERRLNRHRVTLGFTPSELPKSDKDDRPDLMGSLS
jgi:uncharacterized protein YjiS (DUF1127 family)